MTVISEVEGVERDEREYPWLGFYCGTVVLFCAKDEGTVVATDDENDWHIGHHVDVDMDLFEHFGGCVTLSNEIAVLDEEVGD